MDAETYIATYGANLTESEKRYIRAFGAPNIPGLGGGRNASTPGMQITDYESSSTALREAEHRARSARLDREAGDR
jgi:hypothetical protein